MHFVGEKKKVCLSHPTQYALEEAWGYSVKIEESIHWFHGRMGIPFSTSNLFACQLE